MFVKNKYFKEKNIDNFCFKVYKFTKRNKTDKVLIITNFCELGVETLACNYSIPQVLQVFNSYYIILVGWPGREYFYRHLVDEFWELDSKHYWLKDSCNAFKCNSKNIKYLEDKLKSYGILFKSEYLGNFLITYVCKKCFNSDYNNIKKCTICGSKNISFPLLNNIENKKFIRSIPKPRSSYVDKVKDIIPSNAIAIFARNRKTYNRNLSKNFYYKLNKMIFSKGFTPVYLGENACSLNMKGCIDFSNTSMVNDLEFTLSVLSCVKYSIQLWTASTRLSAIVGTPFILVESLEQIGLRGQEGTRIAISSDFDKKKIIISNYLNFLNNIDKGLKSIEKAIDEAEINNWNYIFDLVEDKNLVQSTLNNKGLLNW
jgi:hypothetical protein